MMESDFLLRAIHEFLWRADKQKLAKIVADQRFSVRELIDLTFHSKAQIGFKAAWNLDSLYLYHQELFLKEAIYFLNRFPTQENPSARRHFARILTFMTDQKVSKTTAEIIKNYKTEAIVAAAFEWLIEEKTAVAVKVFCMSALANLSSKHDWIKEELLQTIDFMETKESIAFFTRAREVRKQLKAR